MMDSTMETAVIVERAIKKMEQYPNIERSLQRYARELGVSLDHVIIASLKLIAEEYDKATGNGMIPSLY